MYPNFKWWIGVVEDRADPAQLGRCKVRIIGYHTEDLVELPTTELPWAVPIMPMTSASISGVGETPAYVEGTTVVGFFSDGEDEQVPIIFGTLPGKPRNKRTDSTKGFADPYGVYPREGESGLNGLQEPDLSRLARNAAAEGHQSLINKRATRQEAIPRAAAPHIESIQDDKAGAVYDREIWEEPEPRFGADHPILGDDAEVVYNASNEKPNFNNKTSVYPYNKVTETETGHVFEVDDTPNNGRIHEYHNAGTFYEIQADGSKTTKVVGDEYEITLKDKKVYIKGTCDVTIGGDARMLVTKDMYLEVGGNLFTTVGGDRITKVVGNDMTEVLSGQSTNVSRSSSFRTGGNYTDTIIGNNTQSVGGNNFTMVGGSSSSHVLKSTSMISGLGIKILSATGNMKLLAPIGTFKAVSANMSLKATLNQTVTAATQLIEGSVMQTISGVVAQSIVAPAQIIMGVATQSLITPAQTISAPIRTITGVTTHTGAYSITGALTVTGVVLGGVVQQGIITLGSHKHSAVTPGVGISGTPTL
jgi:hypothetical protein